MGMVVRTNTMALNAYRQLGMNNSAVAKSLEKLSSGFRINRAGDDAAGLAISEKMKAQITGLETASANAQDGISLSQTAEGNLAEVHSMLNRMVELATKSANGTYTSTERDALQSEVDQLLKEIDRISQSANFNGTKLLDGSLDGVGKEIVKETTFVGESPIELNAVAGGTNPQLHKDPTGSAMTSFEIDLDHAAYKFVGDPKNVGTEITGLQFAFRKGDDNKLVGADGNAITYNVTLDANGGVEPEALTKAIYDSIAAQGGKVYVLAGTSKAGAAAAVDLDAATDAIEYEVTMKDGKLAFTMTTDGYNKAKTFDETVANGVMDANGNVTDASKSAFRGNFSYYAVNTDDTGAAIADAAVTGDADLKAIADAFATAVGQSQGAATSVINTGSPNAGMQYAEATVQFTAADIKDGAGIRVGDQYYVWATKDETANAKYGDNVTVIDVRNLSKDGVFVAANLNSAVSELTKAAANNKMFQTQHTNLTDWATFTERSTNPSDADLTTKEGLTAQFAKFTRVDVVKEKIGGTGKALTLQIGDTADAFNKMSVNITDMSSKGLGLSGLDITSADSASAAIDKVKAAINSVSTTRAGMGALQNRLEHTINNLDVAVENLSAANSRIRDTDMAKEMMNYTKMNVLVQSAQAMLAQANQQPQSVLQLLQ